jgi:hypothetical protein
MFATVIVHRHPKDRFELQVSELKARIVPIVRQQPGFVSGTWSFDPIEGRSYSHLVWDSAESAERFVSFLRAQSTQPNPFGIELDAAHLNTILTSV